MKTSLLRCICVAVLFVFTGAAFGQFGSDIVKTSKGDLKITFLGHASLLFEFGGKAVYVDPVGNLDFTKLPKADLVLITHEHSDHFNAQVLNTIKRENTIFIMNAPSAVQYKGAETVKSGDTKSVLGFTIEVIPAYNIVNKRGDSPYHSKETSLGYIITFGDKRIYVAGDTENTPEMKALKNINVAFLPMNLPYTMTPEMVADAAKAFKPEILYIYHYRGSDTEKLKELLKDVKGVELRIRTMY